MERRIKTKIQLIQYFVDEYGFNSYLEIGVRSRKTFNNISCKEKVGIDPILVADSSPSKGISLYAKISDEFFKMNKGKFDIILIDGLHLYEQAMRDIINSWNCLNLNGAIVIHDCLPTSSVMCSRERVTSEWTGDVWKSIVWFRKSYPELNCSVINIDYGCGVIIKSNSKILTIPKGENEYKDLDFGWLQSNLNLLNIKNRSEVFTMFK